MSADRIDFYSLDRKKRIRLGQGDHCVIMQIGEEAGLWDITGLSDDEAEAMGRSLIRRARYSRLSPRSAVSSAGEPLEHEPSTRAAE